MATLVLEGLAVAAGAALPYFVSKVKDVFTGGDDDEKKAAKEQQNQYEQQRANNDKELQGLRIKMAKMQAKVDADGKKNAFPKSQNDDNMRRDEEEQRKWREQAESERLNAQRRDDEHRAELAEVQEQRREEKRQRERQEARHEQTLEEVRKWRGVAEQERVDSQRKDDENKRKHREQEERLKEERRQRENQAKAHEQTIGSMKGDITNLETEKAANDHAMHEIRNELQMASQRENELKLQNQDIFRKLEDATIKFQQLEENYKKRELDLQSRLDKMIGKAPDKSVEELRKDAATKLNIDIVGDVNVAFCGAVKTGKSSLINALRGITERENGAAAVGITECTTEIKKYPCPGQQDLVLWDIPGSDTKRFKRVSYFYDNMLYVFDFLIIMAQTSLSETEMIIAEEAYNTGVPFAIVRSKCDNDLRNIKNRGSQLDPETKRKFCWEMNRVYIEQLKPAIQAKVQKVFCVSAPVIEKLNLQQNAEKYKLHEEELVDYIKETIKVERFSAKQQGMDTQIKKQF